MSVPKGKNIKGGAEKYIFSSSRDEQEMRAVGTWSEGIGVGVTLFSRHYFQLIVYNSVATFETASDMIGGRLRPSKSMPNIPPAHPLSDDISTI